MYKRTTRDEYQIHVNYGHGHSWEHETTEETFKDARNMKQDYVNNCPYPVRIVKKRVKI